jgi:hypothetical protein
MPVKDTHLYTTTFPCHECTRHVIAAGVQRVVYIEPYPKSLAPQLHDDAIAIDEDTPPHHKVRFEPFVGVGPRKYMELFTARPGARKDESGLVAPARAGWLPKSVPVNVPSEEEHDVRSPGGSGNRTPPTEQAPEGAEIGVPSDEEEQPTPEQVFGSTSDHLYIVREKNMLFELTEALTTAKLEIRE